MGETFDGLSLPPQTVGRLHDEARELARLVERRAAQVKGALAEAEALTVAVGSAAAKATAAMAAAARAQQQLDEKARQRTWVRDAG